jgi:hypothetical protein
MTMKAFMQNTCAPNGIRSAILDVQDMPVKGGA